MLGYEATGQVRITVNQLSQLGSLVAAALAAGANHIPSIAFTVRDTRGARDEALRRAVAEARRDAETLAAAAGGRLGDLVDLSTAGRGVSGVIALDESAFEASGFALQSSVPIVPRDVPISVTVTTRWRFQRTPR